MKRISVLNFFIFFVFPILYSQEKDSTIQYNDNNFKESFISLSINGGVGYNINSYRLTEDIRRFSYYDINPSYSAGLGMLFRLSEKYRLRLDFKYVQLQYGMNWSESYPQALKTENTLHYFDINVNFDYLVYKNKYLKIYISPGIVNEFLLRNEYTNYLADGNFNHSNYTALTKQYPETANGGNLSIFIKYRLTNKIHLTFSPGYTFFIQKFTEDNDKPYQRIDGNLGIEFNF